MKTITANAISNAGFTSCPPSLVEQINAIIATHDAPGAWQQISQTLLAKAQGFDFHFFIYETLFPEWHTEPHTAPAWLPDLNTIESSNIAHLLTLTGQHDTRALQTWSHEHYAEFWERMLQVLPIQLKQLPRETCDISEGAERPKWLAGAKMNIIDSVFNAPNDAVAIIMPDLQTMTYGELVEMTNAIAYSLQAFGVQVGDAIGVILPMHAHSVALYLAIIKIGAVVVGIADSFSSTEINTRLTIANAKYVFTQHILPWNGKDIALYDKVRAAFSGPIIVYEPREPLSDAIMWEDFYQPHTQCESVAVDPMTPCNILFSSGTTGTPKAIIWNHTTPIKAASDAYLHQNIKPSDVLAWPTSLGWMMGPWLIFAALINQATLALFPDAPRSARFGQFVQDAKVTMLGVVPTLVSTWRQNQTMEAFDWSAIKVFSSTGECSNPTDMLYLMSLANYKPIIEYCGGTEIGGAYISSTVTMPNFPSLFSTPAFGNHFVLLDEHEHAASMGEVAIHPLCIGLSTVLLNGDHYDTYFTGMPKMPNGITYRRHSDYSKRLANHYYQMLGRTDDTMNLGGIKISAAEIERVIDHTDGIEEAIAIALPSHESGPNQLIIVAVSHRALEKAAVMKAMQQKINDFLNPLFRIHDIVFVDTIPRTASNKTMRRVLRDQLLQQ